jgi:uncharacterized cupredoxin-like copper-binding protein
MQMFAFKKALVVLAVAGLILTACGGQRATEVTITLTEFGIKSSQTTFEVGVPYRFVVTNEGAVEHELMIMPPLTEDQMDMNMDMHELDELALAFIEEDELPSGATATLDFTFTEPAPDGTLEFACHTPNHYEEGMKLPIIVK